MSDKMVYTAKLDFPVQIALPVRVFEYWNVYKGRMFDCVPFDDEYNYQRISAYSGGQWSGVGFIVHDHGRQKGVIHDWFEDIVEVDWTRQLPPPPNPYQGFRFRLARIRAWFSNAWFALRVHRFQAWLTGRW